MPDFFRRLLWGLLKPLDYRVRRRTSQLRAEQWLDGTALDAIVLDRLRALYRHTRATVPYYRDVLPSSSLPSPDDLTFHSFRQVPPLDRETLVESFELLRSDAQPFGPGIVNRSGGTSGRPVRFLQDHDWHGWMVAVKRLFDEWTGYRLGQPQVVLWGSERDLFEGRETRKRQLGRWIRHELWLDAFRMTPEHMSQYVDAINRFRPVQILGYASSLFELAEHIDREGLTLHPPRAVLSSASPLHAYMRIRVEKVYCAPVFDRYGCREFGDAACQCERLGGLHVCRSTHHVEVLRADGTEALPGELGELVVTPLWNHTMPLLRYRVGDQAVWSQDVCECGRGYPMLERVVGRVAETLVRPDGGVVSPMFLIHLLGVILKQEFFKQFQCVQDDLNTIRILFVATSEGDEVAAELARHMEEIRQHVRVAMGPECQVEFEFVKEIPLLSSGKFPYVVSRVARDVS